MFRNLNKTFNLKKIAAFLLAVCLLGGSFAVTAQAASLSDSAASIVIKTVKSSDSTKKKLKKLFKYVEKKYDYGRTVGFEAYSGWEKDYAQAMFKDKKGSCYHFAAAYAFLAKTATGSEVRIGVGQTNGFSGNLQPHAWTEVKIGKTWYICDTNLDKFAANSSRKYCLKKRSSLKSTYNKFKHTAYYTVAF